MNQASCVFVGDIRQPWMSSRQRLETLKTLGFQVTAMNFGGLGGHRTVADKIVERVLWLPALPRVLKEASASVETLLSQEPPELAWFEWPRAILPGSIEKLRRAWPKTVFVCFQDDNPFGARKEARLWRFFKESIPLFDVHFVKRSSDHSTFAKHGAKRTELFVSGYYEPLYERTDAGVREADKDVLFVGTGLDNREDFLCSLAIGFDLKISVFGDRWNPARVLKRSGSRVKVRPGLHGTEYVNAVRSHALALGLVSKSNGDEYTMRSLEIPAMGGFFLGQRTNEHLRLFEEGKEAEFFSDVIECGMKARKYLSEEACRHAIATAGNERARVSHYGLRRRMADALGLIGF